MRNRAWLVGFVFLIYNLTAFAQNYEPKFDGILGAPKENISNCSENVGLFLPYNPVIVEVGGFEGAHTIALATHYKLGHIIVFEPNPRAFQSLKKNTEKFSHVSTYNFALNNYNGTAQLNICRGPYGNDVQLEQYSSILPSNKTQFFQGSSINVPCVILDDWCKTYGVDHIDFLQLDTEGYELQILKSSPSILKTVIVILTKTHFTHFRTGTTQYPELKAFLEREGFEMLSHWYREGLQGEAVFVKKNIYNALFR